MALLPFNQKNPKSSLRSGPIVAVPGFPGERAAKDTLDEIAATVKNYGVRLTDAYGTGHSSPGHKIYGDASDFSGPDKSMDAAVKALVAKGYKVLYDGRFGSTRWPGHGPSYVAGSNAHFHVEWSSGPGDQGDTGVGANLGVAAGVAAGKAAGGAIDAAGELLSKVGWVFSSEGLLTIALVLGGATLAFLGLSRAVGVRAPVPVPGLGTLAKATKAAPAARAATTKGGPRA